MIILTMKTLFKQIKIFFRLHKNSNVLGPHVKLTGKGQDRFLFNTFGLHIGSSVKEGVRYTTTFRYGQYSNMCSVNDGFALTSDIN